VDAATVVVHDLLLEIKPDSAAHPQDCPVCARTEEPEGSMKTYTEDEATALVKAAVAEATAPLSTRVAELETAAAAGATDAKVTEATSELTARVAALQAELDATTVEAASHKEAHDQLVAMLDEAKAAETAAADKDARKAARIAQVTAAEGLTLPDEFIAANADRWADLSDEAFTAQLTEWVEIAKAAKGGTVDDPATRTDPAVKRSALTASADGAPAVTRVASNDLHTVFALRDAGISTRKA
jgi:hypothetical protein